MPRTSAAVTAAESDELKCSGWLTMVISGDSCPVKMWAISSLSVPRAEVMMSCAKRLTSRSGRVGKTVEQKLACALKA